MIEVTTELCKVTAFDRRPEEVVSFSIGVTVGWNKLRAVPAIQLGFDSRLPELRRACSSLRERIDALSFGRWSLVAHLLANYGLLYLADAALRLRGK
jgi:hypothetical protein